MLWAWTGIAPHTHNIDFDRAWPESKSMLLVLGAIAVHAVQTFLLHVILPLIAIHLWIATVRGGLAAAFKGVKRVVTHALAPRSLLIYAAICVVFGATVYFLLFQQATVT